MTIRTREIEERRIESEERATLCRLIDAYEAARLTPGPARAAAEAAIKPWLSLFGVVEHAGRVYWWSHGDDSLVRENPVRYKRPAGGIGMAAVDAVIVCRRGAERHGGEGVLWMRRFRGRAL